MIATLEVINQMKAAGIIGNYAIGGAVGATFYLEPFATLDIDILAELKPTPGSALLRLAPVYDYLRSRGYATEKEYIVVEGWPVQILPPGDPLDEEALREAVETEVEGVHTWVITAEHLVAIALKTARPKDFTRILEFVESGVVDMDKLDRILRRHGLLEKWEQFRTKFLPGSL
jgi:hypothetical protein